MTEHKQVKVTIDAKLAEEFKAACAAEGISIAAAITGLMRVRVSLPPADGPLKPPLETRRQRRRAAHLCAREVERIRDAEEAYLKRIPENLTGAEAYCAAEEAIEALDHASELLREAF